MRKGDILSLCHNVFCNQSFASIMNFIDSLKKNSVFLQTFVLLAVLYALGSWLRGIWAPGEYSTALEVYNIFPELRNYSLKVLRIPAAVASFATALLVFVSARLLRFSHPWRVTALYMVLPPVYYLGTAVNGAASEGFAVFATLTALLAVSILKNFVVKFFVLLAAMPFVWFSAAFAQSSFWSDLSIVAIVLPVAAVIAGVVGEYLERKEKLGLFLNLFSHVVCKMLLCASMLIFFTSVLRSKWSLLEEFALFKAGESVSRPVLGLLVPMLWIHVSRGVTAIRKKLAFTAIGVGFLIFSLPFILPWEAEQNLVPERFFDTLPAEYKSDSTLFFADEYWLPVLECKGKNVAALEQDGVENAVENIEKKLQSQDVIFIYRKNASGKMLDLNIPGYAKERIFSGENRVVRYLKRSVK